VLHTLCVTDDPAAQLVGQLSRKLTHDRLQQLQVRCLKRAPFSLIQACMRPFAPALKAPLAPCMRPLLLP